MSLLRNLGPSNDFRRPGGSHAGLGSQLALACEEVSFCGGVGRWETGSSEEREPNDLGRMTDPEALICGVLLFVGEGSGPDLESGGRRFLPLPGISASCNESQSWRESHSARERRKSNASRCLGVRWRMQPIRTPHALVLVAALPHAGRA